MRSFRQILWRHVTRFLIPAAVLGPTVLLLFNWAFYDEYPTHRRIVLYSVGWFISMAMATLTNAWMEWRRARRATME